MIRTKSNHFFSPLLFLNLPYLPNLTEYQFSSYKLSYRIVDCICLNALKVKLNTSRSNSCLLILLLLLKLFLKCCILKIEMMMTLRNLVNKNCLRLKLSPWARRGEGGLRGPLAELLITLNFVQ